MSQTRMNQTPELGRRSYDARLDCAQLDGELAALDKAHNESMKALAVYAEPAVSARYHSQEAAVTTTPRGLTTR